MLKDFDPPVDVSSAAPEAGNIPEIRISSADRPHGPLEEPQAISGPVALRKPFLSRAARIGAAIAAYSLAGAVGWLLYGFVAPHYASWSDFMAAKFAQTSAAPVDLLPVTQKMAAEIQALQTRVEALEKARSLDTKAAASLEELNRRIDAAKAESNAEISALSSRFLLFQQEANTKIAEMSAARPVENKAAHVVEKARKHAHRRRADAFDPSLHPTAPGAPRPLGARLDRE
ncbi:MAG TPA: OmpH family outer membrane protein, partial [Methylocystis sp.]|nr:OmpH family outer membrane protein [Methylocystis sp.]